MDQSAHQMYFCLMHAKTCYKDNLIMSQTLATFSKIMQMFIYQFVPLMEQWLPLNTEKADVTDTPVSDSYCHISEFNAQRTSAYR